MPTPGRRRAVGWRPGPRRSRPRLASASISPSGWGLVRPRRGCPFRDRRRQPRGIPNLPTRPFTPAGGGRGKSRPGGPAAPRAARADRKSKVAAWGVGRSSAPLSGARTGSRTGNVDPVHDDRKSKVAAWGVGRPSAALSGARTGSRTGNVGLGNPVGGWAPTRRAATATGTRSRGGSERVREMRSARVVMVSDLRRGEGMAYILYSTSCTGLAFRAARESSPSSMGRNGLRILPRATGGAGPRGRRGEGGGSCQRARRAAPGPSRCGTPPPS